MLVIEMTLDQLKFNIDDLEELEELLDLPGGVSIRGVSFSMLAAADLVVVHHGERCAIIKSREGGRAILSFEEYQDLKTLAFEAYEAQLKEAAG